MWSDKETTEDLLGYTVHASLLKSVVTNDKNLPITVGLYGDWGSGKSSILRILEKQLKEENDTIVVYFDGWSFESFDDAKMALIQGIVDALEKDERFFEKVLDKKDDLKESFKKLRKSINWMRVLKISAQTIIPIATAASTGGASLMIPLLIDAFAKNKEKLPEILTGENAEQFLKDTINAGDEEKKYEAVREFRKDFEDLIDKSKQGRVVVLIDDLDRCLPRHIIENLEAIKLFLDVPKTAFVIAADSYIVSNAIESEYKEIIKVASSDNHNDRREIGNSYMEKFIQLPYKIPALSRKEVETYVTLLFCKSILDKESFEKVREDFTRFTHEKRFERYGWDNIHQLLQHDIPDGLGEMIGFVAPFSFLIGNSLRWNPRLIKRFLNAYEMRSGLLAQTGITDTKERFALLKLMLIEQKYERQFKQMSSWVMNNVGVSEELKTIEQYAEDGTSNISDYQDWNSPELLNLVVAEPKFSTVDMKELFWVSRDNLVDEMSGLSLVPARISTIFKKAYNASSDPIRDNVCKDEVAPMSAGDIEDFFDLADSKILTNPADKECYGIFYFCIKNDVERAYARLLNILSRIDTKKIPFSMGNKFKEILEKYHQDKKLLELLRPNDALVRSINGKAQKKN